MPARSMPARPLLAAVLLGALTTSTTGARAQCAFDQSTPNANDALSVNEPAVRIDFMLEFDLQQVRVVGADNSEWPTDWVPSAKEVRGTRFRVTRPLPPGKYLIEWNGYLKRHQHADGGSIPFTVLAQDGGAPTGPAPEPRADLVPRSGPDSPYRALLGAGAPQPGR